MKTRINIFSRIHKALRAMLYDTALCLQLTDFSNEEEAQLAFGKLEAVLHQFTRHAEHEDKFILPVAMQFDRQLVQQFDQEHEKDEFMTHRIRSLINVYQHAANDDLRADTGEQIARTFNEFIAFNLYHMNKEEEKLNPILWQQYSDDQIRDILKTIVKTIPQEETMMVSGWMMRGISDAEIVTWLQEIKNDAPCFVFQGIIALAEQVLSTERWNRIQCKISEGLQIA